MCHSIRKQSFVALASVLACASLLSSCAIANNAPEQESSSILGETESPQDVMRDNTFAQSAVPEIDGIRVVFKNAAPQKFFVRIENDLGKTLKCSSAFIVYPRNGCTVTEEACAAEVIELAISNYNHKKVFNDMFYLDENRCLDFEKYCSGGLAPGQYRFITSVFIVTDKTVDEFGTTLYDDTEVAIYTDFVIE